MAAQRSEDVGRDRCFDVDVGEIYSKVGDLSHLGALARVRIRSCARVAPEPGLVTVMSCSCNTPIPGDNYEHSGSPVEFPPCQKLTKGCFPTACILVTRMETVLQYLLLCFGM